MNRLKIFQIVVIFIFLFLFYIKLQRQSKFTATNINIIPWNQTQEKNRLYIYLRDPLSFDLQMSQKSVYSSSKIRNDINSGYNTVMVRDKILIEQNDRIDLFDTVNKVILLQHSLVDDLDLITLNLNTNFLKKNNTTTPLTRDYLTTKKIDLSKSTKYKRLGTGLTNGGNIIVAGDFNLVPDIQAGVVRDPSYYWEISYPQMGSKNEDVQYATDSNGVKYCPLYYLNCADEIDVYDESSVTFRGGVGCIGRYTKKMNVDERHEFNNSTNNGQLWEPTYWEDAIKSTLGAYKNGCKTSECNKAIYKGYPVEPAGWYNQYYASALAVLSYVAYEYVYYTLVYGFTQLLLYYGLTAYMEYITGLWMIGPIVCLLSSIGLVFVANYLKPETIAEGIYQLTGLDMLDWTNSVEWYMVYRSYPPITPKEQFMGTSAVLTYINLKNSIDSSKIPYLRQVCNLSSKCTYFLSFYFFGFVPLIVNIYDPDGNKIELLTQNDVSYNDWLYRSTKFNVLKDGTYTLEFTLNIIGDDVNYPGSDPFKTQHRYHGRSMVDDVILEVVDEESTFDNYSEFIFSNEIRQDEVYLSMNGKLQRISLVNNLTSPDPSIINQRRAMMTAFISKNFIP